MSKIFPDLIIEMIASYIMDERSYIKFRIMNLGLYEDISNIIIEYGYYISGNIDMVLFGHKHPINCLAVLDNGKIVSGSNDIKIWSKEKILEFELTDHTSTITCCAKLSNNKFVTGSRDNTLKIWNSEIGVCERTLIGHRSYINCVTVLPNGKIVSGSNDISIKIWDPNTGIWEKTFTYLATYLNNLSDILLVIATGGLIRILNLETYTIALNLHADSDNVNCLAILPDNRIISGSNDNTLKIWSFSDKNINSGTKYSYITLTVHIDHVLSICVLPDNQIVSGSRDGTIKIWSTDDKIQKQSFIYENTSINSIAILGRKIVIGSSNGTIKIIS